MHVRRPLIAGLLIAAAVPPLLPLVVPPSTDAAGGWLAFIGRFHPLLVHFPVALVPLVWALDVLAARRTRRFDAVVPLLLWLAAASALAAFTVGLLLARGEGTTGSLVSRHYWGASAVVSAMLAAAALRAGATRAGAPHAERRWLQGSRVLLTIALLLIVWTGHLGSQLTHGETYLTDRLPWRTAPVAEAPPAPDDPVFDALVDPIFRAHCTTCHGASRVEGGLRVDSFAALMAGGNDGVVVDAGDAEGSEVIRRVTLPRDHEDAMPADGRPPLSDDEVAVLRWWIAAGASDTLTVAEAEDTPEVVARLLAPAEEAPEAPPLPLDEAAALARATGLDIVPVSQHPADGFRVTAFSLAGGLDAAVAGLAPIAALISEADLSHSDATDATLDTLETWTSLRTLNLAFTAVRGSSLAGLGSLPHLEALNLAGTSLDADAGGDLAGLTTLRHLVLSGTPLSSDDVDRVAAALPDCTVIADDEVGTR